jgi:hypothetical protein
LIYKTLKNCHWATSGDAETTIKTVDDPEQLSMPLEHDLVLSRRPFPMQTNPECDPLGKADETVSSIRPVSLLQIVAHQKQTLNSSDSTGLKYLHRDT